MKKPVLFIFFNRREEALKVLEQIKLAAPPCLYLVSDGPRNTQEKEVVENLRHEIFSQIDWDCEIKTRFLDENFGCGLGIYKAINWFFENESDGIILEDDCVPSQSFFTFCEELLDKYKDDKQIWHICGSNFLPQVKTKDSYYFSKIMHGWGWASWADRWKHMEFDLKNYDEKNINKTSENKNVRAYWNTILNMMKRNEIEAWDYQWLFTILKHNGVCVIPFENLIKNIGFNGCHFNQAYGHHRLNLPTCEIENLIHPCKVKIKTSIMNNIYKRVFLIGFRKESMFMALLNKIRVFWRCR